MVICGLALWQVNSDTSKLERITGVRLGILVHLCHTSVFQEINDMGLCSWHLNFAINIIEIIDFREIIFNHSDKLFQKEFE